MIQMYLKRTKKTLEFQVVGLVVFSQQQLIADGEQQQQTAFFPAQTQATLPLVEEHLFGIDVGE